MKLIVKLNQNEKKSAYALYQTLTNPKIFDVDKDYVFQYPLLSSDDEIQDITLDQVASILYAISNDELELVLDN